MDKEQFIEASALFILGDDNLSCSNSDEVIVNAHKTSIGMGMHSKKEESIAYLWDGVDFDFANGGGFQLDQTPFNKNLEKLRLTVPQMQGFKYIAVLRGLDVGAGIYSAFNSGSVVFVQDTAFETLASWHFKPWEHYIPFRQDGSNLIKHFKCAESNQDACLEMVNKAQFILSDLLDLDLKKQKSWFHN